jgi:hypothetical protein
MDVRARILRAYPNAARFVQGPDRAPHSYFHVVRWLDARNVEVQLHGHTDGEYPIHCFDLRFRVSRDGEVKELSRLVLPATEKACETIG